VFPDPVGAQISACAPLEIASQPPVCAGVGPSNEASNPRHTGAENGANASDFLLAFALVANPPILRKCDWRSGAKCALSGCAGGANPRRRSLEHRMVAQSDQGQETQIRDRHIWALVKRQHGVIAHSQLREFGL